MATFNPELFLSTLALIGVVIVISALLSGLVEKTGLPQVAVFLGLGAAIGPFGLNLINADLNSPILRVVGTLSLVLVLFTDAVSLNLSEVRKQPLLSFLVVGPGTVCSAFVIAFFSWWLLGLSPAAALILGAALASTDPVMLRALFARPGVDPGVRQVLRLEGGMNDAVLLPLVLAGITLLAHGYAAPASEWAHLGINVMILSPAAGVVVGLAAVGMLDLIRRRVGVRRDYESIYSLGVAFAAYAAAESTHGSGFLAAFAAGLTISALDVELCDCFLEYGETTAEMALMFTFVLFGMSVIWKGLGIIGETTLLFVFAAFAARPIAFIPALLPARLSWRDRAVIAWFGPRALSSLLLVLIPVFAGIPGSERLLTICCLVVLFSVVLHGLSPIVLFPSSRQKDPPPAKTVEALNTAKPKPQAAPLQCSLTGGDCAQLANLPLSLEHSEYISIAEVKARQAAHSGDVVIIDSRSERTFAEGEEDIPGAIRLPPDQAVRTARQNKISQQAVLVVLCA